MYYYPIKKWLLLLIFLLLFWQIGSFAGPFLSNSNARLSDIIYGFYAPSCHQMADRCFTFTGAPLTVCARCGGIYLAGFLVCVMVLFAGKTRLYPLTTYILMALPAVIDFFLEKAGLFAASPGLRFITGMFLGAALFHLLILSLSRRSDEFKFRSLYYISNP